MVKQQLFLWDQYYDFDLLFGWKKQVNENFSTVDVFYGFKHDIWCFITFGIYDIFKELKKRFDTAFLNKYPDKFFDHF